MRTLTHRQDATETGWDVSVTGKGKSNNIDRFHVTPLPPCWRTITKGSS